MKNEVASVHVYVPVGTCVSVCVLVCWWIVHLSMYKERPLGAVGCLPPTLN